MDPEVAPSDTASLKHLAQACARLFEELSRQERTQQHNSTTPDHFWALRQSAEFNLWCTKTGVDSEGLRSIDTRLKDVPEICHILLQLLDSLYRDLTGLAQHNVDATNPSSNPGDDYADSASGSDSSSISFQTLSSSQDSALQEDAEFDASPGKRKISQLVQHVGDTIDRLQGQARRIEQAGAQHRKNRIEAYKEKERPAQVYEGFRKIGLWKAEAQYESASQDIKDRLSISFARRRIRNEYLKEHQKKRAVDSLVIPTHTIERVTTTPNAVDDAGGASISGKSAQKLPDSSGVYLSPDQKTLFSETVNTKYNFSAMPKARMRAESVRSVTLRHPGFPPPPRTRNGRFQCPYCLLEFHDREAEKDRWSRHVMQDFEPYFCTHEDCESPFDVPNSFDGLLKHMQSHLPVLHHVDHDDGEHAEYAETEYEIHVQSHGDVSDDTMAALKEASRRKGAFLFESCPFCGGYPDVIEARYPSLDTVDAQNELRRHIKQHMQESALFLPPYRSDIFDDVEDDGASRGPDNAGQSSKSGEEDDFEDEPIISCGLENCSCKTDDVATKYAHGSLTLCRLCGNGDEDIREYDCPHCDNHRRCGNCHAYESHDSITKAWSQILAESSLWNRSSTTDSEVLAATSLHSFITRFAFYDLSNTDEATMEGTPKERAALVCSLIERHTDCTPEIKPLSLLALAVTDSLTLLKCLLGIQKTAAQQDILSLASVREYAQTGQLGQIRRFLTREGGEMVSNAHVTNVESSVSRHTKLMKREDVTGPRNFELELNDIRSEEKSYIAYSVVGDRIDAFYKTTPVWIEIVRDVSSLSPPGRTRASMDALVAMLRRLYNPDFIQNSHVPSCLGYFQAENGKHFGLVFETPATVNHTERPKSLGDLIASRQHYSPSLDDRLHLMNLLCDCVQFHHAVGHLHHNIRSDNILFFTSQHDFFNQFLISGFGCRSLSRINDHNLIEDKQEYEPWRGGRNAEDKDDLPLEIPWTLRTKGYFWRYMGAEQIASNTNQESSLAFTEQYSRTEVWEPWVSREAMREEGLVHRLVEADVNPADESRFKIGRSYMISKPLDFKDVKRLTDRTVELRGESSLYPGLTLANIASSYTYGKMDLYRHPLVRGLRNREQPNGQLTTRFNESHDLYALAIVLLELILWEPIQDMLGIQMDSTGAEGIMSVRARLDSRRIHRCVQDIAGIDTADKIWSYIDGVSNPSEERQSFNNSRPKKTTRSTRFQESTTVIPESTIPPSWLGDGTWNNGSFLFNSHPSFGKGEDRSNEQYEKGQTVNIAQGATSYQRSSVPVKSILKDPTVRFPEESNPIREGVAPHKSVPKSKEIPVGARWTKIDRRLVNSEALEKFKERFEEREDCVIVLRVLTKNEIQKLADATRDIREDRERSIMSGESHGQDDDDWNPRTSRRRERDDRTTTSSASHFMEREQSSGTEVSDSGAPRAALDDGYSYTDPAGLYRDTANSPRRPKVDPGSPNAGPSRDDRFAQLVPSSRLGPSPSSHGWDRISQDDHRYQTDVNRRIEISSEDDTSDGDSFSMLSPIPPRRDGAHESGFLYGMNEPVRFDIGQYRIANRRTVDDESEYQLSRIGVQNGVLYANGAWLPEEWIKQLQS